MGQISFQLSMIRVEEHVELAWLVLRALSVVLTQLAPGLSNSEAGRPEDLLSLPPFHGVESGLRGHLPGRER